MLKIFSVVVHLFLMVYMPSSLFAKVPIVVSDKMMDFVTDREELSALLRPVSQKNEESVLRAYEKGEVKLAIVRADMLQKFYKTSRLQKQNAYHVIGRVSGKAVLLFAARPENDFLGIDALKNKTISIGKLGDKANVYLKKILQKEHILYNTHLITQDAYRSIGALKKKQIDAMFLFESQKYLKMFEKYLLPYPKGFKAFLEKEESLSCEERYCYASYYLIASDTIGERVMQNIYKQIVPFLAKNKALSSNIGRYYIDTTLQRKVEEPVRPTIQQPFKGPIVSNPYKVKSPKFHRAPWMDLAIAEAMIGKGSAENVLPMLDLSYKYIRFAKGDSGITTAPNDNKEGSWCAAYICWTLGKSGYKIHPKGRMASQSFRYFNNKLYRKIDKPIFGAITLYTSIKNPGYGHVGYLFGKTKSGRYILLGGNQSNRLKFADYPERFGGYKLRGFYVPIDYEIKGKDKLTSADIYKSAQRLNNKYGISSGGKGKGVR